ncbi:RluA family pseudouridine synthase [Candidatus Daviesbacteria bacterium]|nr:RluA family pseudouridine synthase [Candidatus Daviesbacteria bacterium]
MAALTIIYQDPNLLVIDKPAGLTVSPTETSSDETLADIIKKDFNIDLERAGIVHRLDKDTSGVILVAKTTEALENLQHQFQTREVKKEYLTLVHGFLQSAGQIIAPIGRNPKNREKFTVLVGGKEAQTTYQTLKHLEMPEDVLDELFADFSKIQMRKLANLNYSKFSLVRVLPLTGRTHQIRVHLKHIGFAIVGDEKYGGRKIVRLDHRFCQRQFLHASKISFKHPKTNEQLVFESPIPDDLKNALSLLKKVTI